MGYFQNQHANWLEYAERANIERVCEWCNDLFIPLSPNQRFHTREQEPACADDRRNEGLSIRTWLAERGFTPKSFIAEYGPIEASRLRARSVNNS